MNLVILTHVDKTRFRTEIKPKTENKPVIFGVRKIGTEPKTVIFKGMKKKT